jgi:hypothetical protein
MNSRRRKKTNPKKGPKARLFLIRCGREFHTPQAPTVNEWPMAKTGEKGKKGKREKGKKGETFFRIGCVRLGSKINV